jgi:hypothetical protein
MPGNARGHRVGDADGHQHRRQHQSRQGVVSQPGSLVLEQDLKPGQPAHPGSPAGDLPRARHATRWQARRGSRRNVHATRPRIVSLIEHGLRERPKLRYTLVHSHRIWQGVILGRVRAIPSIPGLVVRGGQSASLDPGSGGTMLEGRVSAGTRRGGRAPQGVTCLGVRSGGMRSWIDSPVGG